MVDYSLLKRLPKVDLHCHLSGSVRPATIMEIALEEGLEVPSKDMGIFTKNIQVSGNCQSLKDYLTKFDLPLKVMQKQKHLYRITYELLEDLWEQNIKYVEIRIAPYLHMEQGLDFHQILESVLNAMDRARKNLGIYSNLILICMRNHSPEISLNIVKEGHKYVGKGVVAIDLAGNEIDFSPELHKEAFQWAGNLGLRKTVHAGEVGIAENIITAVKELGAERIGHGVYAFLKEDVCQFIKDRGIPLEMCITSNVQTGAVEGYKAHPIKKYLDRGMKVTINTDNLTVSDTTLEQEYKKAIEFLDFNYGDLIRVIQNGIEFSFADEGEKERLKEVINRELESLNLK
ncbi:adenosine deaminase [Tepidimicrobium xylanilyticum]|uniref:adenosine deaminase n=1 Tax=Tepidimicrobium xylanilyticum TaxID=1123352 RepID=A0A1H2QLU9_9FIRM|nr:adenosine deaminase [Tepidimicrobium xylanilyticum]GMG95629.1 adenosine deaminase [Tepidimicrobium xylanilyticum]SDW08065.1 adenosine deaminase [Tepidimicrobium xylanilyticum]